MIEKIKYYKIVSIYPYYVLDSRAFWRFFKINDFKITEQYQETCERIRNQTEKFLVQMARIRTDPKKWNNLLRGLNLSLSQETKVC